MREKFLMLLAFVAMASLVLLSCAKKEESKAAENTEADGGEPSITIKLSMGICS